MPAAIQPGQHWRTKTGARFRVVRVTDDEVHACFTTRTGIDYRTPDAPVHFSYSFVRRSCTPVAVAALAVGADA